ncbi:SMI1/KNR4 family protein [uncultured Chryseobacterium sp.]|uniref:SMI1/KNR4 family protein n=1 Tax=uncultured Chryseobacterium sp. TaxID=259322 RepID=UPI003748202A
MEKSRNSNLELLKKNFEENCVEIFPSNIDEIEAFQKKYDVEISEDLYDYYLEINGSGNDTLNNLYEFYSISNTKKINEELINFRGIPDYSQLNFDGMENVFIFGGYQFNLYAFGIELHQDISSENRIYIFNGKDFRIMAKSFTEFVDLYLNKPDEIYV